MHKTANFRKGNERELPKDRWRKMECKREKRGKNMKKGQILGKCLSKGDFCLRCTKEKG